MEAPHDTERTQSLKGKIVDVKKGAPTAHVSIDIGGQTVTASITNESADELKLEKGQKPPTQSSGNERHGRGGLIYT